MLESVRSFRLPVPTPDDCLADHWNIAPFEWIANWLWTVKMIAEERELSLKDLAVSLEDSSALGNRKESPDTDAAVIQLLSECFGVNGISGTCIRHVTCPVITGLAQSNDSDAPSSSGKVSNPLKLRIVSCRVCYVEEKSVGIRQYPTFAAVVAQLKSYAGESASNDFNSSVALFGSVSSFENANQTSQAWDNLGSSASLGTIPIPSSEVNNSPNVASSANDNLSTRFLFMLQQPGAMESCLKRLNQVQNWMLRAKEKDLLLQQLQLRNAEKRLNEALQANEELKGTVKQLRRTIQQDLKVIKTMATQQMEDELAASSSHHHAQYQQQQQNEETVSASSSPAKGSPAVVGRASSSGSSPSKSVPRESRFSPTKRAVARNISSVSVSIPEDEEQPDAELELATDEAMATSAAATPDRDIGRTRSTRSLYWSNEALKSTTIFQSFRGGLLDIPKSPPAARHDRDNDGNVNPQRKKLQLNTAAMDALQLPSRALSRSNSTATPNPPLVKSTTAGAGANSVSLDAIAAKLSLFADGDSEHVDNETATAATDSTPTLPTTPHQSEAVTTADSIKGDGMDGSVVASTDGTMSTLTMASNDLVQNVVALHLHQPDTLHHEATSPLPADTTNSSSPEGVVVNSVVEEIATEMNDSTDSFDAASPSASKEFFVTGATCQDKFGDEGTYTGYVLVTEGLPHGVGKMEYESGRVFDGDWVSGQWHGQGKLLNPNGDSYDGEFFFDARHGQGVYRWDNGDVYVGSFSSDKRHGKGKFSFHNGNVYTGEFCDGMFEGFGRYDFEGGYYEGDWKEGRYDGSGELLYATGGKYTGEFRNSVAHGFGMEVLPDGTKRRGVWVDGKPTE
jgi:hypothetical protein